MNSNPCDSDSSERGSMTKKRRRTLSTGKRSLSLLIRIYKANVHTMRVGWAIRKLTNAIGKRLRAQHPTSRKTLCVDAARASKHAINLPRSVCRETIEKGGQRSRYIKHIIYLTWEKETIIAYGVETLVMNLRCSARKGITNRIRSS